MVCLMVVAERKVIMHRQPGLGAWLNFESRQPEVFDIVADPLVIDTGSVAYILCPAVHQRF